MTRTLYARLAAVLVGLLCTIGVLYGLFTLYATQHFLLELNQRLNRDLARQLLVERKLMTGELLDQQAVHGLFAHYMHVNPAIEVYLLDAEGRVIAFEAPEMKIKRRTLALEPVRRFLAGDTMYPILGDDPRHEARRKVFSAAAIPARGEPQQYLYLILGGEAYDSVRTLLHDSYFLQLSLTAVAGSVLFGLAAGLAIFALLTRRLTRLTRVMSAFRDSGFREHRPYGDGAPGGDEVDTLGHTFDRMARTIIGQVAALEAKDGLRRNLVANVSHDLRTPLAALRGYLETLQLRDGELSAPERRRYLDIALRQSEGLSQLVEELFELSRLDAAETRPEVEPLALGELVQDVAQKFRLAAQERGIDLHCDIPADLPLVQADVRLLDRALGNLLQNALAHTPAQGRITVALAPCPEGVRVSVANSGSAIAAEDLPHLFERFYQAPERRGRGAGLGLAIVRRIVELHGGEIGVSSRPGEPTTFSFPLPRVTKT